MASQPFHRRVRCSAFSLVEVLVTLAIIAILVAMTVPSVMGTMRAYELNATGELVINQLNLARQAALSNSHLVQVRFYRLPDFNQPPTAGRTVFRAMQSFTEGDPTTTGTPVLTPLSKPVFFPQTVVILTGNVSPLLSASPTAAGSADPMLPVYVQNYDYSAFHYRPDGSTDLTSLTAALTVVEENDKVIASGLPANYQTLQVDPTIGTVRIFRP
jgi:uncharacterized protein (TIGR02596 family)